VNVTTSLYHLSISQQELPLGNLDPQWELDIGSEGVNANASCLEAKQRQRQKQRQQQSFNILPSPPHAQGGPTISRRRYNFAPSSGRRAAPRQGKHGDGHHSGWGA